MVYSNYYDAMGKPHTNTKTWYKTLISANPLCDKFHSAFMEGGRNGQCVVT